MWRRFHTSDARASGRTARALLLALAALATAGAAAHGSTPASLEGRISAARAREGELHAGIGSESHQIAGFQGTIEDLHTRLDALEWSLAVERGVLLRLKSQLHGARVRLAALRVALARDRQVLIAQVVAAYETPPPDVTTVLLEAHGFADLIERVDDLQAISRENADATRRTAAAQRAVGLQASRLAALEQSRARETRAVLVQRDEVAQLHLALVDRQLVLVRARDRKSAELASLRDHKRSLEGELSRLQEHELGSLPGASFAGGALPAPEGGFGFFAAPGTNYSVGEEPTIASRLNTMGRVLHLHLIGISGYRSPQHSVEVGGFANDPHTRGEASDTPGTEGIPESTLNRFGLTRPFPGAAEADHIQLQGSA